MLVLHTAVDRARPGKFSALHISHSPKRSTKQGHKFEFTLKSRLSRLLSFKTSSTSPVFTLSGRSYLPVGGSVSACCRGRWISRPARQSLAFSAHCPLGLGFLACSPQTPADCLRKKAIKWEEEKPRRISYFTYPNTFSPDSCEVMASRDSDGQTGRGVYTLFWHQR